MPINFTSGDIFLASKEYALAHGCNCSGAMGKGIAVEFKKRWPGMYLEYKAKCVSGEFSLGSCYPFEGPSRTIYNLGTQKSWRAKAEISAISKSCKEMLAHMMRNNVRSVMMPKIGAGLGGLEWSVVKEKLFSIFSDSGISCVVCEEYIPGVYPVTKL